MNTLTDATARTWDDFRDRWAGPQNFLLGGECAPFEFDMPPLDRVIAEMRDDPEAAIGTGRVDDRLVKDDFSAAFRAMPVEKAMDGPFTLAHFKLSRFDAPGKFLHGFGQRMLDRWSQAFSAAGFTFERCYPIIFISGKQCATNYHMDFSHVLAWQVYGTKIFCGLKDPDRWAPRDVRVNYKAYEYTRPAELTDEDALCFTMRPGDALWNVLLTPHWVNAGDDAIAMSVNISHGGVRLNGKLSPNEQELEAFRQANPDKAPKKVSGVY